MKLDMVIVLSLCQSTGIARLEKLPGNGFIYLNIRYEKVPAKLRRLGTVTHARPDSKPVPAREFRLECWLASLIGLRCL